MTWREDQPADYGLVKDWAQVVRQRKVDIRSMLSRFCYWNEAASGASAGIPKAWSTKPGNLRAFSGSASQVSAFRDGALMVTTSDTSDFYVLSSTASCKVSSRRMLVNDDTTASQIGAGTRNLVQVGFERALSATTKSVTFSSPYNAIPSILLSVEPDSQAQLYTASASVVSTHGFSMCLGYWGAGADPSNATVHWLASGLSNV